MSSLVLDVGGRVNRREFAQDGMDDFTLVHQGTGTIDATNDVGHTGLVSAEGRQVGLFGGLVMGEGPDATRMVLGALLGQETQVTVAGSFELSVRPERWKEGQSEGLCVRR